jgi:O-antigen ligase
MIIVAFGLAIFVYTLSRFGKKKALYISAIFLMILASALLIFSSNNRFSNRISFVPKNVNLDYEKSPENTDGYWGSINLRIALAKNALEIIKSNPVLGTGIGDEKSERLKQYNLNHFYFGINQEFNEHNQYLNILLSSGAIGLLILLNLLGYPFLKSFQNSDFLYLAFITLIVFSFLSENYLSRLQGVSFFAFFHTLFWIQNQQTNKTIQSN